MNFSMRFFVLVWVVCLGVSASGRAQDASPTPTPAPSPPVKFTTMAWDGLDPEGDLTLNYKTGGKLRQAVVVWRDRSMPLPCDGAGALVFSRTVVRDGEKVEEPVATAMIPVGAKRVLLVFGRNPKPSPGETAVRIAVIDDSYEVFPGQSVRLLNYSRSILAGRLGESDFEVAPGGDRVVPAALPETNRLLSFRLARRDEGGAWRKLRSTGLPMAAEMRVLVFLLDAPGEPGRVEMVMVRDRVEPPPAPESRPPALAAGIRVNR